MQGAGALADLFRQSFFHAAVHQACIDTALDTYNAVPFSLFASLSLPSLFFNVMCVMRRGAHSSVVVVMHR